METFQIFETPEGLVVEPKMTPVSSKGFLKKSRKSRKLKFLKKFAFYYNPVLYVTFALLYFGFNFITLSKTGHKDLLQTSDHQ